MLNNRILVLSLSLFLIALSFAVLAHGGEDGTTENLEATYAKISLNLIYAASIIAGIFVLLSIFYQSQLKEHKTLLFLGIIIPCIVATLFLAGSTIYLNMVSETNGPIHWHADFEIYACGENLNILDPIGMSNRKGSSTFHEHNDNRIHVEGVVLDSHEVDLHAFFEVLGGHLDNDGFGLPTSNGFKEFKNGDLCNGAPGRLQAFLYRITNPDPGRRSGFKYEQIKLDDFPDYVLSPYENIPPGDCIIIEFTDEDKEFTENICETYRLAIQRGDIFGG